MIYTCKECKDIQYGEADCLKHSYKYGHNIFIEANSNIYGKANKEYCPQNDNELAEGEV